MSKDDDLDDILDLMESRARGLNDSTTSDSGGLKVRPGTRLRFGDALAGVYYFERILHEGDGRLVLQVKHRATERRFAMKVLPAEISTGDAAKRFQEEAQATSAHGHPNIVFVTDFGRSPELGYYYVMEYLNGDTLEARLASGEFRPTRLALDVAADIGAALATAHDLGLVHCNVQPENIMSHRSGDTANWKLLDFGLSSKVVSGGEILAFADVPTYIAPEVAAGVSIGPAADQFSLAATLFHCVYGKTPWADRTWTTAVPDQWTPPVIPGDHKLGSEADNIADVLLRGLAAHPNERFPDIDVFVSAFQSATGLARRASVSPVDVEESRRVAHGEADPTSDSLKVDLTFSGPSINPDVQGSVEISVADITGVMELHMSFRSARRLRREWRRNIIGGGVFVPTGRKLEVNSPVAVVIDYRPENRKEQFPGMVVGRATEPVPGLSVEIDPEHRDQLHRFISGLNLSTFEPMATVERGKKAPMVNELTTDEQFVLSKLPEPRTIGSLRRLFSNLPVPVDDVVARLEEKGWVRVLGAVSRKTPTDEYEAITSKMVEIDMVHRRADYLRGQGNFLAEIETLKLAVERYEDPALLYRLAFARLQFRSDLDGAIANMEQAVQLEPDSKKYVDALKSLKRFADYDPDTV